MKVLVVVAGALHTGYVAGYGNEWIETPALDTLAAEGVVFDQHYADRPDSAGARRAWRTGCYHFPLPGEESSPEVPGQPDLLRLLREQGIATALVRNGPDPPGAAFAEVWDHSWTVPPAEPERTRRAVRKALDRLGSSKDWLLWVDLGSLYPPWDVPEEFLALYFQEEDEDEQEAEEEGAPGEETEEEEPEEELEPLPDPSPGLLDPADDATFLRLQRTYAAAVTRMDDTLGQLLEGVGEAGLDEEPVIVFTADRGLALGEHGVVGEARPWLHDELIHVPLIVRLPGGVEAGRRSSALTQPVDLMPTLLELFGLPPAPVHGRSLLPLLRGESEQLRAFACSGSQAGEAIEWALRTPEWGFLLPLTGGPVSPPRPPQLYVKPDDRWEVNNVLQHHLELTEHLEQVLRGFVEATRQPGPLRPPELRDVEGEQQTEGEGPGEEPHEQGEAGG